MNAGGVAASMCFPSFPQFCGQLFARTEDKALAHVMVQAYNDWHVDEWCGAHVDRFIPCGILPLFDVEGEIIVEDLTDEDGFRAGVG